jgi:hypothetical protein
MVWNNETSKLMANQGTIFLLFLYIIPPFQKKVSTFALVLGQVLICTLVFGSDGVVLS